MKLVMIQRCVGIGLGALFLTGATMALSYHALAQGTTAAQSTTVTQGTTTAQRPAQPRRPQAAPQPGKPAPFAQGEQAPPQFGPGLAQGGPGFPGGPGGPGFPGGPGGPGFPGGPGGPGFGGPMMGGPGMGGGATMTANAKTVFILRGNTLYAYDAETLKLNARAELPMPQGGPGGGPGFRGPGRPGGPGFGPGGEGRPGRAPGDDRQSEQTGTR